MDGHFSASSPLREVCGCMCGLHPPAAAGAAAAASLSDVLPERLMC